MLYLEDLKLGDTFATGTQAVASVVEDPQPEAPTSTVAVAQPGPPTPDAAVVPSTTVEPAPPVERASPGSTSGAATPPATDVTELADVTPDREPASEPRPPGASATHQRSDASHGDPEATQADPEAPTQPVARDATEWPRPIEPHGSKPRPPHADDAPSS